MARCVRAASLAPLPPRVNHPPRDSGMKGTQGGGGHSTHHSALRCLYAGLLWHALTPAPHLAPSPHPAQPAAAAPSPSGGDVAARAAKLARENQALRQRLAAVEEAASEALGEVVDVREEAGRHQTAHQQAKLKVCAAPGCSISGEGARRKIATWGRVDGLCEDPVRVVAGALGSSLAPPPPPPPPNTHTQCSHATQAQKLQAELDGTQAELQERGAQLADAQQQLQRAKEALAAAQAAPPAPTPPADGGERAAWAAARVWVGGWLHVSCVALGHGPRQELRGRVWCPCGTAPTSHPHCTA